MTARIRKPRGSRTLSMRTHEGKAAFSLNRDEAVALAVAIVCVLVCSAAIFGFATMAFAEDAGDAIALDGSAGDEGGEEVIASAEGPDDDGWAAQGIADAEQPEDGEPVGALAQAAEGPLPFSGIQPVIIAALIMGVALAVALIVSLHGKPDDKLGGPKGDVW